LIRRGRPLSFDRAEALEAAMNVFWAKGYEGATLEDLLEAMGGITAPSLYNAFGSKEQLFKEAIDLYVATKSECTGAALDGADTARAAVEIYLRMAAEGFSGDEGRRGCMILSSATHCGRGGENAEAYARSIRLKAPEGVKLRLLRAQKDGELSTSVDVDAIASFYATVAQGIGLRAGDGISRAELDAVIAGAMAAWDTLITSPPPPDDD
jgi:AcrR family transcriptional regulator